jgi:hypothetical protein
MTMRRAIRIYAHTGRACFKRYTYADHVRGWISMVVWLLDCGFRRVGIGTEEGAMVIHLQKP